MLEININTPALLFPAITLLMLAFTNRFLSLASLVGKLHTEIYYWSKRKKHFNKNIKYSYPLKTYTLYARLRYF
jgi:hypothetical protein